MKSILTILRRTIHESRPGCHIVLVLDAASQHLAADIIAHAARLHFILMLVPARLTWLLQPLDTHVFAPLKRALQTAQQAARAVRAEGILGPLDWVEHLDASVRQVLVNRDWSHALAANGVLGDVSHLRSEVQHHVRGALPLPLRPPTPDEMSCIIGRHRRGLHAALLRWPEALAARRAAAPEQPVRIPVAIPPSPPRRPLDEGHVAAGTRYRHLRL